MNEIDNPFVISGYAGPEYFCDRKEETAELIEALRNSCHVTVMSPRRYGKTGLIHNAFWHVRKDMPDVMCFYIDIYATSSLSDFVQMLGKAIIGKLGTPLQKAEGLLTTLFRSSQITMSPDLTTGLPSFGLSFQPQYVKQTLDELFSYIQQSGKRCYIAIDEFQQVMEYPEENIEALLRTYIQKTNNAHFIFSGSKLHMMAEMFSSPKHPFYRSTERLPMDVLNEDVYYNFITEKLKDKSITMDVDTFHYLYDMVDGVTWYIQYIMNRIYRKADIVVDKDVIDKTIQRIILSEEDGYKRLLHLLTNNQATLLKAIAAEGIVKEPTAGKFIRSHNIKSPSSIQRALSYLLDEEYVYHKDDGYIVYDRFFGMWLKTL